MSEAWTVRTAGPGDVDALVAGNVAMAHETEGKPLDARIVGAGVRRALRDPARGRYWVADGPGGRVIGQLLLTREWSDWRDGWFWWIQSVYVWPEWRGRGVYRALYEHVAALAREDADVRGLRLYVERENRDAIAVYERLGMRDAGYRLFEVDWSGS